MANVHLALGSNLGDKQYYMTRAVELLEERVGRVLRRSGVVESEPWGYSSTNSYLNEVLVMECNVLEPLELLDITQDIERSLGRVGRSDRSEEYSDRTIDIDLLYYHTEQDSSSIGLEFNSPSLTLPHPEIEKRDFLIELLKIVATK